MITLFLISLLQISCLAFPSLLQEQQHVLANTLLSDCSNYNGMDACKSGDQTDYPAENESRRWQTPPPGHPSYKSEQWQNYRNLQGYARVTYNSDLSEATVEIVTFVRVASSLLFQFGSDGEWSDQATRKYSKESFGGGPGNRDGLVVTVWAPESENAKLTLDPLFFAWENPPIDLPHTQNGQKGAIVELFGWPYKDIASECAHLGKAGYMGVKVFTVQEHVESFHYLQNGELNPWYLTYQPVSYRTHTRLGSRNDMREMILQCRKHGVRVYADAVINHMSGSGNDILEHRNPAGGSCVTWGAKNSSANSPYFTHSWTFEKNEFTQERPALEFPAVPYGPTDFHCERSLNSWSSGFIMNYGWLVGLTDLNTGKEYVQQRIADYLTDLMGLGFSGFRVDAAKHIRPDDLAQIFGKFRKNMGGKLPKDFISWLEVIIGGEKDLLACRMSDYNYYQYLDDAYKKAGLSDEDIAKIKIWSSDYPKEHPICGHWVLPASRFAIQNDDHDQQNAGSSSRDMADKGSVLVIEKNVERHKNFEKQLFERNDADWTIKLILSGYTFMENGAKGYPDGFSDCEKFQGSEQDRKSCRGVPYSPAYDPNACGYSMLKDGRWMEGKYTRVHRDRDIIMAMRKWAGLSNYESEEMSNEDLGLPARC